MRLRNSQSLYTQAKKTKSNFDYGGDNSGGGGYMRYKIWFFKGILILTNQKRSLGELCKINGSLKKYLYVLPV